MSYYYPIPHRDKTTVTRSYVDSQDALDRAYADQEAAVFKAYTDQENAKQDIAINDMVSIDGTSTMRGDLKMGKHSVREMATDANDKDSAVSVEYLEKTGFKEFEEKLDSVYYGLFTDFVDLRRQRSYQVLPKSGGGGFSLKLKTAKGGGKFIMGNSFSYDNYHGSRGLQFPQTVELDLTSLHSYGTQFLFLGFFKRGLHFKFVEPTPSGCDELSLSYNGSNLVAVLLSNPKVFSLLFSAEFLNARVVLLTTFGVSGFTCTVYRLEDGFSETKTFGLIKSFTPLFMQFQPMEVELLGFIPAGSEAAALQRLLLLEKKMGGVRGPQGDKGDTGAQGPQGAKGDTGAQGPQGAKGDTGAQGPPGAKGDTGVQGPPGAKGDTGTGFNLDSSGNLDMGLKLITRLSNDPSDLNSAATTALVKSFDITNQDFRLDSFAYIMQDVNESKSESNIVVDGGIVDFTGSPHFFNKKAYSFKITSKDAKNVFSCVLALNMFKLPMGRHTLIIEFFPPEMRSVLTTVGPSRNRLISVGNCRNETYSDHVRSVCNLHKTGTTPPLNIYITFSFQGTAASASTARCHSIFYGFPSFVRNVEPVIFDRPFTFANDAMKINADLDLNGHNLLGLKNFFVVFGECHLSKITLGGYDKIFLMKGSKILSMVISLPFFMNNTLGLQINDERGSITTFYIEKVKMADIPINFTLPRDHRFISISFFYGKPPNFSFYLKYTLP